MSGAQKVYNIDTEISKWHVRSWPLFCSPLLRTSLLDPFGHSHLQPHYPKPSHTCLPLIFAFSAIAIGGSLKVTAFHSLFIPVYVFHRRSHTLDSPHSLTHHPHIQVRSPCRCSHRKWSGSQKVRCHPARWPRGRGGTSRPRRCVHQQTNTRERQR